jgi:hypothetical protein
MLIMVGLTNDDTNDHVYIQTPVHRNTFEVGLDVVNVNNQLRWVP